MNIHTLQLELQQLIDLIFKKLENRNKLEDTKEEQQIILGLKMTMKRTKRTSSAVHPFTHCKDLKTKKRLHVVQMRTEMERCVVKKKRYGKKAGEARHAGHYLV